MKKTSALIALILTIVVVSVVSIRSSFADGMDAPKRYHHRRTVWVAPPPYEVCRFGWWQTLTLGPRATALGRALLRTGCV